MNCRRLFMTLRTAFASTIVPTLHAAVLLMPLAVVIGCGVPTHAGISLRGIVTLDGEPLPEGQLLFIPLEQGSQVRPLTIQDGEFSCDREHGLTAGTYRVEILVYESTGQLTRDPDLPAGYKTPDTRQVIPRKYNSQSILTCQLPQGGDEPLRFDLESR